MALANAQIPSVTSAESVASNAALYWERFDSSELCFESDLSIPVQVVDVQQSGQLQPHPFSDGPTLAGHLDNPVNSNFKLRLISICQINSWAPLQASKEMMRSLVQHHSINPAFLEVPLSFSYRRTDEEQGFTVPWTLIEDDSKFELFYTFRYPQFKGNQNEPWVLRQSGVYHRYDIKSKSSFWILISPMPDSAAEQRVITCLNNHQEEISRNPLWLHSVIHTSYFGNWRQYLASYERVLLPIADTTTATFITETLRVNHDTLGKVRSLESRFLPIKAILENFVDVLDELESLTVALAAGQTISQSELRVEKRRLENCRKQCSAYSRTSHFLQQRSDNTATLLADTLAFKNQGVAAEQNDKAMTMTQSTVFITILGLVYLPWTFVSVWKSTRVSEIYTNQAQGLFGMNFFVFDTTTRRIEASPEIWVYFIVSACLTAATLALYYVIAGRVRRTNILSLSHIPGMTLQRGYTGLAEKGVTSSM